MKKAAIISIFGLILLSVGMASAQTPDDLPWWNQRVFYEIFVRSFYDSDGDGIGDIQGIISQLDYLNDGDPTTDNDLGVTGIWLMPINEATFYHGYDVIDYRAVERQYGTMDDFRQLIAEAHKRGIAVIIDLVVNHTSNLHPWFVASQNGDPEYQDWYVWSDEDLGTGWHEGMHDYYYGYFWAGMPDLNYNNPDVTAEMTDIARFWLTEMNVDGFRIDAAKYLIEDWPVIENTPETLAWFQDFNAALKSINAAAMTVGEVWDSSFIVYKYVTGGSLDLAFEFDMALGMVQAARRGDKIQIESVQKRVLDLYPPGQYGAFLTNHDQNRVMSELGGKIGPAKVAASLLLTNPGVPFIYYGEEIGMTGKKPDELIRRPMQWDATPETGGFTTGTPWQALAKDYTTTNVAAMTDNPESLLNHYRKLIHLRNAHPALWGGDIALVTSDKRPVYSILRYTPDEVLLVIVNLSGKAVPDYTLSLESGPLTAVETATVLFGDGDVVVPDINAAGGFDSYTPLAALAPYSTTVIHLR